jgi:hypothetical protein
MKASSITILAATLFFTLQAAHAQTPLHIARQGSLQTWSSSGLLGYLAAAERPEMVKGILAVETSVDAFDAIPRDKLAPLARVPILIVIGDRAPDRAASSRAFEKTMKAIGGDVTIDVLPEAGITGNGHTLMLEKNNKQIMYRMIAWLEAHRLSGK